MEPLYSVLAIVASFLVLSVLIAKVEGLSFLAPASTSGIRASAQGFCSQSCRKEGLCPMTGTAEAAADCPLWKYIDADVPTAPHTSPFEPIGV